MSKEISVADIETPSSQFEQWLVELNEELEAQHKEQFPTLEWEPLCYTKGRKYAKIISGVAGSRSVWGFVAMQDVNTKNKSFKEGDLLKAAGWNSPAKHARGNIFEGNARYTKYGPEYLVR